MSKKNLKRFFVSCMIAGFLIILGTAGKSDTNDLMTFKDCLYPSCLGLSLVLIGFVPLKKGGHI